MKYLIPVFLFLSNCLFAQFGPPTNLGISTASGVVHVFPADLDNDGDMDVLSSSSGDDKIAWYENLGNDQYAVQKIISTEADEAMCVHAADLDNDGDMDVLSASAWDDKIAWYENDGSGNFGSQMIISSQITGAYVVTTADLDGDNDLDVIAAFNFDSEVLWFENLGGGVFGVSGYLISDFDGSPYSISVKDLDNDSDLDVVVAYNTDTDLIWYPNDGGGTFGSGTVVSSNLLFAPEVSVYSGDLDGDGDNEILSTDYIGMNLYENLGGGNFGTAQNFNMTSYRGVKVHLADTDNDGDLDILAFFQIQTSSSCRLLLYENTGNLTFLNPIILAATSDEPIDIMTTNLNQDGAVDIIAGYGSRVKRFLNLGQNNFSSSRILNTHAFPAVTSIIDMDNDGDNDILENGTLSWFPNEGVGTFGPLQYITEYSEVNDMATSDFNGDSYPDIVLSSDYELLRYLSLGNGSYSSAQLIDSVGLFPKIQMGDLDNDGDDDIVCSIDWFSPVKWIENQTTGTSWQIHTLGSAVNTPLEFIADLDNNGLKDILATYGGTTIRWHKNLGAGNFSSGTILDNSLSNIHFIHAADLNNDGLSDIIYCFEDSNHTKLVWRRNMGNGNFAPQKIISAIHDSKGIVIVDIENDGDQDVISYAESSWSIVCYKNDGLGNFGLMNTIYSDFYGVSFVTAGDITGDSLPDLASVPGVLWFENLGDTLQEVTCSDPIQFQLVNDTVCIGQTISGIIAPVADSGYYTWNLGNLQYMYGNSFSWTSNVTGTFDLGIYHTEGGCTNDTIIKVFVESCLTLGEYEKNQFAIYPNPANTEITISITDGLKGEYLIELKDLLGKKILQRSMIEKDSLTIPVLDQSSGIYLLSITNMETGVEQIHQLVVE